ncbi:MAG: HEAT repeat domain-containing protein [Actinomycetota bacterium]
MTDSSHPQPFERHEQNERLDAILAGFSGDESTIRRALTSSDGKTRSSALRALERNGTLTSDDLSSHVNDESNHVRRRVAELGARHTSVPLVVLLHDSDLYVAEMAAWAFGERSHVTNDELATLIASATEDERALVRRRVLHRLVPSATFAACQRSWPAALTNLPCVDEPY